MMLVLPCPTAAEVLVDPVAGGEVVVIVVHDAIIISCRWGAEARGRIVVTAYLIHRLQLKASKTQD